MIITGMTETSSVHELVADPVQVRRETERLEKEREGADGSTRSRASKNHVI